VGTPWQKMLCISLCLVAFSPPVFSAPTTPPDEPTPAKKQAADNTSPAVESEAGPTFPNPVASDDSKSKVLSKAQPLESDASKGPSAQDESAQDESAQDESDQDESTQDESKPTDQPVTKLQTPNFDKHVPLINDDILLAPEPYSPTCNRGGQCKKQCKQCRQCACSHCGCDHDTYLLVDFLFFKRNNATNGAVITETVAPVEPVLTTRSTNPGTAPGIRLFGGRLRKNGVGWEFGYTGVFGMFGERTVRDPSNLQVADALGDFIPGWTNLDGVRSTYASSLNMCEVNILTSQATTKSEPNSRFPWRRVHDPLGANVTSEHEFHWLGGFRWAGFNDVANLYVDVSAGAGDNDGTYSITTNSQMLGPQIGFKTKRKWTNWSIQGWTKATLAGTFLNSDSAPIDTRAAGGVYYRDQTSARDVGVGFIGDMNYSIVRRLNRNWSLRAGYNLIWISGVALAPNQFDFTNTTTSGTTLANTGNVFLHGANLGFEAQW
jgi:hypothetical protein